MADRMRVSRSEFEATVRKAARGADWPPSLAEDLSRAAGALAATGGPGGELALQMVEKDGRDTLAATITAFELSLGGEAASVTGAPSELLQGCALCLGAEHDVGFDVAEDGEGATIMAKPEESVEIVEIFVDPAVWSRLGALAHKSYVPASEASRLAGAGAGLTDND